VAYDAEGRVLVEIRVAAVADAVRRAIEAVGADVLSVSEPYRTVTARIAASSLGVLARVTGVEFVSEVLRPLAASAHRSPGEVSGSSAVAAQACTSTVSEGDGQLNAAAARAAQHVDGAGVIVGVLSDSFDRATGAATHAAGDVVSGDLPGPGNPCGHGTPVQVLDDSFSAGAQDEGRAVMQVVHDLAPGAGLAFATAAHGLTSFASNIGFLADNGATVIVDDVGYLNEPFFQEGPVSSAINTAVANGVTYVTAAGNDNVVVGGQDVSSWETPAYRPVPCPAGIPDYEDSCNDFRPGADTDADYSIGVNAGQTVLVDMQYAEPWFGVRTDLDLYLIDGAGSLVAGSETYNVASSQQPVEVLGWTNTSASTQQVRLVVGRYSDFLGGGTATPRLKFVLANADIDPIANVEYPTSTGGDLVGPTVFGHHATPSAITAAAVPYDDATTPQAYTSRGPTTFYYGPTTRDPSPPAATALPTPQIVAKPDVAATDGGRTTFFAQQVGGVWRFYGSSAAAAHTAGIVALIRHHTPSASPPTIATQLASTATVIPNGTSASSGAGLINALTALAAGGPPLPTAPISAPQGVNVPSTGTRNRVVVYYTPVPNVAPANGGATITKYRAMCLSPGTVVKTGEDTAAPFTAITLDGLSIGVKYACTVQAVNPLGAGPPSTPAAVRVSTPKAPALITTNKGTSAGTLKITWTGATSYSGTPITGYTIICSPTTGTGSRLAGAAPTARAITFSGLTRARAYRCRVAGTNRWGTGTPRIAPNAVKPR
jgi:hypothetical protein